MILNKKNTNKVKVVKKYNNGGKENPTPSDQIKKAEEARNFIKLLYGDQHTRDMINRNLRFVDMGSFDENDNYIPSDTRAFLDNPPDISQDTPEFAIPTVNEVIKADISANPIRFKVMPNQIGQSSATIADYFPGTASNGGRGLYENLAMMYPNRVDELATRAGVANLYADLMSDYSATMGNFITGKNELLTSGYVQGNPRPGMAVDWGEDGAPNQAYYIPRISGLGKKEKPMTMGMGKYQNRMNEAIQVNKNADMGTYVHEMTHAGDLSTNSFNDRYIDQNKHYYNSGPDSNEMDRKQKNRASSYGMSPDQFASYVSRPTETLARLNVLRYAMYKHFGSEDSPYKQEDFVNYTYGQVPTRDMKIFKDQGKDIMKALEDLQAVYPDDVIFEMLNNIY